MSDEETFLARWSRRKHAAAEGAEINETTGPVDAPPAPKPGGAPAPVADPAAASPVGLELPEFDLASLPPIESIGADTDIRAFLAAGVPPELTRAALRRAWATDPKIRDFVGLAENQWDFNKPTGVPGFRPLQLSDQVQRMVADLLEPQPAPADEPRTADANSQSHERTHESPDDASWPNEGLNNVSDTPVEAPDGVATRTADSIGQEATQDIALQQNAERPKDPAPRRGHGGALPR